VGATALGVTLAGVWAASVVVRELANEDPQVVVVDEVAGTLITLLPMAAWSWRAVVVGVFLFRLFDIVKPWPIRKLERLPGGWGVVMDDVGAGVLGAVVMGILRYVRVLP
jgi:phosphatidylglycerophosphatase A